MQIFSTELCKRGIHTNAVAAGGSAQFEAGQGLSSALHRERRGLEAQLNQPDSAPTETLRLALRRYRALFRVSWLNSD